MKPILRALGLMMIVAYSLLPFAWQVLTSIKPDADLLSLPPLLPSRPTSEHYAAIFRDSSFPHMIFNSAVVATMTTLLALAVATLAAFALTFLQVRRKPLILALVLSVSMFPPIATVSPLFLLLNAVGLRDTLAGLILTYTTFSLPLAIWLLTHFFSTLPRELYVAARIDGCTAFGALRKVILPLATPGLLAAGLMVFIYAWNEFLFALSFTSTDAARTIPVAIALFPGLHVVPWGEIAAASVVVSLPLVMLAVVFQRQIVEGLTAGAVKG
ncbi:MAG: carbohydrate ABC transporter permease [Betaproteobacteria bacterium]